MILQQHLDILAKARDNLSHEDYVKIWGEYIGNHIWNQDRSDLLRIWSSGLTTEQKKSFINYILENFKEKSVCTTIGVKPITDITDSKCNRFSDITEERK